MAASRSNVDLGYGLVHALPEAQTPLLPTAYPNEAYREAPLHRPYPSQGSLSQFTPPQQYPPQQYPPQRFTSPGPERFASPGPERYGSPDHSDAPLPRHHAHSTPTRET